MAIIVIIVVIDDSAIKLFAVNNLYLSTYVIDR